VERGHSGDSNPREGAAGVFFGGPTEQLAEKAGERKENHPTAAEAGFILLLLRHGWKPCPFKELKPGPDRGESGALGAISGSQSREPGHLEVPFWSREGT